MSDRTRRTVTPGGTVAAEPPNDPLTANAPNTGYPAGLTQPASDAPNPPAWLGHVTQIWAVLDTITTRLAALETASKTRHPMGL